MKKIILGRGRMTFTPKGGEPIDLGEVTNIKIDMNNTIEKQSATGLLAAILIGLIIGGVIYGLVLSFS